VPGLRFGICSGGVEGQGVVGQQFALLVQLIVIVVVRQQLQAVAEFDAASGT